MRKRADMHGYQNRATKFLLDRPAAALWLDMGLGKTVCTLTAADSVLTLSMVDCIFVVAPIRVIQSVWRQQSKEWDHTRHLTFSLVHGTEAQRFDALRRKAQIYLINYENLQWLVTAMRKMRGFPPGKKGLVLDEASKVKSHRTKRFKALKRVRDKFEFVWELTGTPAPNSYMDIFSQIQLLDKGQRFGTRFDLFREEFFKKTDYMGYHYSIRRGSQQRIERAIGPLVLRLDAADYREIPPVVHNDIYLDLPPRARGQYSRLEDQFFLELESGEAVEAFNAAALTAKLWQFCNGALYDTDKNWHAVHDAKLDALEDVLEEAEGQNVLIAYWFKSDLARLRNRFKDIVVFSESKNPDALIQQWREGKIKHLAIHPQSGGHGIDGLQYGGHILVFYSQTWSLEMHDQLVARLDRQGQTKPVIAHYLMMRHTVDEAIRDAIATKSRTQRQLLNALLRYRHSEDLLA